MGFGSTALRYAAVAFGAQKPTTQTTELERALLVKYLKGKKKIVEVGVFEGYTTKVLTENADADAKIYGVDPFFKGRIGISWGYRMSRAHNARALKKDRLTFVRTLSTEVGDQIPEKVDFVFIDADHSLDAIIADWSFWSNRIAPGGIIGLHDSIVPAHNPRVANFGSHQYFESTIKHDPRFEVLETADSLAILHHRGCGAA
jgi:predicted O-methyltransferase YrrM